MKKIATFLLCMAVMTAIGSVGYSQKESPPTIEKSVIAESFVATDLIAPYQLTVCEATAVVDVAFKDIKITAEDKNICVFLLSTDKRFREVDRIRYCSLTDLKSYTPEFTFLHIDPGL